MGLFHKEFYEPKIPRGWKKAIDDMNVRPDDSQPVQGPTPGQAKRPGPSKTK